MKTAYCDTLKMVNFNVNLHAFLSYKERLYKELVVEYENHKERTLVKLGRVKEQVHS